MLTKLVGAGTFILGLLIVIGFPDIAEYQVERMGRSGIIIGLILIIVGLYLMKT